MENQTGDINLALMSAIAGRDVETVVTLLNKGADVHYNDDFALRGAVYLGYIEIAGLLLKNGANVHAANEEPLFTAIRARDDAMMDMLLAHDASMDAVLKSQKVDREGRAFIGEVKSRKAHEAFQKQAAKVKAKAKRAPRPVFHL